eukprot:scaffold875_cov185-Amphora_coffeaeformis.AAC.11
MNYLSHYILRTYQLYHSYTLSYEWKKEGTVTTPLALCTNNIGCILVNSMYYNNISLITGAAALTVGVRALDIAQGVTAWYENNKSKDVGRLYEKVRKLREDRAVVEMIPTHSNGAEFDYVRSSNVEALINLFGRNDYGEPNPAGVVYVLYEERGNGKTHARRALMREFHQFRQF